MCPNEKSLRLKFSHFNSNEERIHTRASVETVNEDIEVEVD